MSIWPVWNYLDINYPPSIQNQYNSYSIFANIESELYLKNISYTSSTNFQLNFDDSEDDDSVVRPRDNVNGKDEIAQDGRVVFYFVISWSEVYLTPVLYFNPKINSGNSGYILSVEELHAALINNNNNNNNNINAGINNNNIWNIVSLTVFIYLFIIVFIFKFILYHKNNHYNIHIHTHVPYTHIPYTHLHLLLSINMVALD
jgi:hypothetical protein